MYCGLESSEHKLKPSAPTCQVGVVGEDNNGEGKRRGSGDVFPVDHSCRGRLSELQSCATQHVDGIGLSGAA